MATGCEFARCTLTGFHDKGHETILAANGGKQFVTSLLIHLPILGETAVADDAESVFVILLPQGVGLFITAGQYNLGTSTHAQLLQLGVEGFTGEEKTLLQHKFVEKGQETAVEPDVVLHQKNHLHTALGIVFHVHLVLHKFDDGQQQFRVAQPAEHVLENAEVFLLHPAVDTVTEGSEHHNGNLRIALLDETGDVEDVIVVGSGHTDEKVVAAALHLCLGFL